MIELPWVLKARHYIGVTEIKGSRHNPVIVGMLDDMGRYSNEARAWWREDETPWCGLFLGWILGECGRYVVKEWYRAKAWADSGMKKLTAPAYGAIAVMDRAGGGHVGIVVGKDAAGNIMLLSGNVSDMVKIAPFAASRITGYYWPAYWIDGAPLKSAPAAGRYNLPLLKSNGQLSTNEA